MRLCGLSRPTGTWTDLKVYIHGAAMRVETSHGSWSKPWLAAEMKEGSGLFVVPKGFNASESKVGSMAEKLGSGLAGGVVISRDAVLCMYVSGREE